MKKILVLTVALLLAVSCANKSENGDENSKTKKGAGIGAFVGAVAGSILSKDKKKGALIGGVVGATAGGLYGKKLDKQAEELREVAETRRTDRGIITKLKGDITFETGKANVKDNAVNRLEKMAKILKKYPENNITVLGHTDSTGSMNVNKNLSEERAKQVKEILVSHGVPSSNIQTLGLASKDPVASNNTYEGRAENRRVELAITMSKEAQSE